LVAFGTTGRIAKTAIREAARHGVRADLFRPITLFPFPFDPMAHWLAGNPRAKAVLVVEMSAGQMIDDVRLAVQGRVPVHFYGRTGGVVPLPDEIADQILKLAHPMPESAGSGQSNNWIAGGAADTTTAAQERG
jgi:2-oxoglutarate ferredoxin oxidoreductase subunit alpha